MFVIIITVIRIGSAVHVARSRVTSQLYITVIITVREVVLPPARPLRQPLEGHSVGARASPMDYRHKP
jgi:hypothetical protein